MPEYLAPGVYIEEIEIGAKPIEGVSTSTAGFLGPTKKGPISPMFISNFGDFQTKFGGFVENSYLTYGIEGFFRNGGQRCFVGRIIGKGAGTAQTTLAGKDDSELIGITAVGPGNWGNTIALKVEDATLYKEGKNELFKLTVLYWKTIAKAEEENPDDETKNPADAENQTPDDEANNQDDAENQTPDDEANNQDEAENQTPDDEANNQVDAENQTPDDEANNQAEPDVIELYDNLSPTEASSDYFEKKINGISNLITVGKKGEGRPDTGITKFLSGGNPGQTITLADYSGDAAAEPGTRTGLAAFEEIDDISIVCVPDENSVAGLTTDIVNHCEKMKDRFAVLQAGQAAGTVDKLEPPLDSKYAAFYYPWITIIDPITGVKRLVPPGGHIAGLYARSDTERGVHKAPANEVVRGAQELQLPLKKAEQDMLNPKGVNCLRVFPGRGIRVWGARTTSSDPLWKYLNVRRLFLFIEGSIDKGTQWVVFEPNNEKLWARVNQTITQFLTGVWRTGALMGLTPGEAFFVKCDRTTMTQDDIDNGRLIVMIGIAPVKPAEFVIFRIAQWAGGSAATE